MREKIKVILGVDKLEESFKEVVSFVNHFGGHEVEFFDIESTRSSKWRRLSWLSVSIFCIIVVVSKFV